MEENTEPRVVDPRKAHLRQLVRYAYDMQKQRIAFSNRAGSNTAELSDKDQAFMGDQSEGLEGLEKATFKEIRRVLREFPIWKHWLEEQRGVGPAMGGVIISCIDIHRAEAVSNIWSYAGLAVGKDGKAVRRVKGQKANFDPWFKSKMIEVLAGSFIKAGALQKNGYKWRNIYDDRKHRRQNQLVDPCMACAGVGKAKAEGKLITCWNCEGEGKGPWGFSPKHRDLDAKRVMVKIFLRELYVQWRTLEGLPVRKPYEEEYLNRKPHGLPGPFQAPAQV